jgi:ankyrin repeat protein
MGSSASADKRSAESIGKPTNVKTADIPRYLHSIAVSGKIDELSVLLGGITRETQERREAVQSAVDIPDVAGRTALMTASFWGHIAVVDALLQLGALVNARDGQRQTPLMCAAAGGQTDTLVALLSAKTVCTTPLPTPVTTPVHTAADATESTTEDADDLKSFPPPTITEENDNEDEERPSHAIKLAVHKVKHMLSHGVQLDAVDEKGRTVLHHAAGTGNTACIIVLVDSGCDVNAKDADGNTPLHHAASTWNADTISALLACRGDPSLTNHAGLTPQQVAQNKSGPDVTRDDMVALFRLD